VRAAFFSTLADLADDDERIVLLTGDLGFMFIEQFADRHPRRFINVGVAEQNMIGLATGLAEGGYIPFAYSIATFAALRPFEFIRNGPVQHRLPVRIVGVGGGFEYGTAGSTHHGLEDLAVMRSQPGLAVIAPVDHRQAAAAVSATARLDGPIYFRLGKDDRRTMPGLAEGFDIGRIDRIGHGTDVAIVSTGAIAFEAVAAMDELTGAGVASTVFVVPTLNPSPAAILAMALAAFRLVVSVEAHYVTGGLGSLVAEVIADHGVEARLVRIGVDRPSTGEVGGEAFLNEVHGLTALGICRRVCAALQGHQQVA
jgi:transketolase